MFRIKHIHYWVGLLGLLAFILTGYYMHFFYDHLKGMPNETRMLYRSSHIYILLASIINLVIGVYLTPLKEKIKTKLQYIASALILIAPILLLIGFFTEAHMQELQRPFSKLGTFILFGSSLLFSYIGFNKTK